MELAFPVPQGKMVSTSVICIYACDLTQDLRNADMRMQFCKTKLKIKKKNRLTLHITLHMHLVPFLHEMTPIMVYS